VSFNVLPKESIEPQHGAIASIQFVLGLIYVAAVFAYGFDTQLEGPQSGFPARLFTLPVRTVELVAGPMLQGTALVVLLWLAWAYLVLRPAGIEVSVWSTALQAAALVTVLQALLWVPFGLAWVRVVLAVVVLLLLALAPQLGSLVGMEATTLDALYAAIIPLAALAAFVGVSRARRGDSSDWGALLRRPRWLARRRGRATPFGSATAAQFWYECRRHLLPLPLVVVAFTVLFFTVTLFAERPPDEAKQRATLLLSLLFFPTLVAACFGTVLGKTGTSAAGPYRLSSFTAVRPLPVTALVAAKLKVAALSAAVSCGIALAAAVTWCVAAGGREAFVRSFADFFRETPVERAAATLLLVIVAPPLLTWRAFVENLWMGLTGRAWLVRMTFIVSGLLLTALALLVTRLMEDRDLAHRLWGVLPWWAGAAALVKLLIAAGLGRVLLRRGLIEPGALARVVAVWVVAAVALFGLARGSVLFDDTPVLLLASGAVLVLPLARLAAAPLALAWNRHR
ncbi:MAG TPA: hypothetical protein VFW33_20165, partial [Gemmataceae bacterium]|nr:hypothetical protein [Gemmataceae bacterium]